MNDTTTGWARRSVSVLGVLVLSFLLAIGWSLWSLNRSIDRVEVDGLAGGQEEEPVEGDDGAEASEKDEHDAEALTVLLLGSDSREGLTREEQRELGTGGAPGDRTEVISLARLSPDDGEVRLLNVPRDSYVERCDGSHGRVNAAYEIGGVDCTVETLKELTGVSIDHVVRIDFGGFVDVIDELGGVTMYLDEPLQDDHANLDLPAGCVELDGRDALAFVRARRIDDDYGRIARQHRLLDEVRAGLAELGVLDDLPRTLRVAEAVARSVELDSTLDIGRLQQLVREHRSTVQGDFDGKALPGEVARVDGALVLELDEERIPELVSWLITGEDDAVADDAVDDDAGDEATPTDDADSTATADEGAEDGPSADAQTSAEDGSRTLSGETPAGTDVDEPAAAC